MKSKFIFISIYMLSISSQALNNTSPIDMMDPHVKLSTATFIAEIYKDSESKLIDKQALSLFKGDLAVKQEPQKEYTRLSENYYLQTANREVCKTREGESSSYIKSFNDQYKSNINELILPKSKDQLHCTLYFWATSGEKGFYRFVSYLKTKFSPAQKDRVLLTYQALWLMKQGQYPNMLSTLLTLLEIDPIFKNTYKRAQDIYSEQQKAEGRVSLDPM